MKRIKNKPFFCSWSGGKDCCLALYRAIKAGGKPNALLTMTHKNYNRVLGHGLPLNVLKKQAESLGMRLVTEQTKWEEYEKNYLSVLRKFAAEKIKTGVFGDIDLQHHKDWVEEICRNAGIAAFEPLWKEKRKKLINELLDAGFKIKIISLKEKSLGKRFLGRILTKKLVLELEKTGIDLSGELGEYHTIVTDGPIFKFPVKLHIKDRILKKGYWVLDVRV